MIQNDLFKIPRDTGFKEFESSTLQMSLPGCSSTLCVWILPQGWQAEVLKSKKHCTVCGEASITGRGVVVRGGMKIWAISDIAHKMLALPLAWVVLRRQQEQKLPHCVAAWDHCEKLMSC